MDDLVVGMGEEADHFLATNEAGKQVLNFELTSLPRYSEWDCEGRTPEEKPFCTEEENADFGLGLGLDPLPKASDISDGWCWTASNGEGFCSALAGVDHPEPTANKTLQEHCLSDPSCAKAFECSSESNFQKESITNRASVARMWIYSILVEHGVMIARICVLLFFPTFPDWIGDAKVNATARIATAVCGFAATPGLEMMLSRSQDVLKFRIKQMKKEAKARRDGTYMETLTPGASPTSRCAAHPPSSISS